MSKKPLYKSRLGLYFLFGTLGSLFLAVTLLFGMQFALHRYIDINFLNQPSVNRKSFQELQTYVTDHNISYSTLSSLNEWRDEQENRVLFFLFSNGRLVYDSTLEEGILSSDASDYTEEFADQDSYSLQLSDSIVRAAVYNISYYDYYKAADAVCYSVASILFAVFILIMIRSKLHYIAELEDEIRILEGGDLSYPMTVRGKDELADLANGIECMRISILERQQGETNAQKANRELIAAMSHDLRTPLTSLLGYLELLLQGKFNNEQQVHHFLVRSQEKAQRIKDLSDKLFEYFLVYAQAENNIQMEAVDAFQFFSQVLDEHIFDLTSSGFIVHLDSSGFVAKIQIETDTMFRVFDNLFGNIKKYADKTYPVIIHLNILNKIISIDIKNHIDLSRDQTEGTYIGLHTCDSVIHMHGGSFVASKEHGCFSVKILLPISGTTN